MRTERRADQRARHLVLLVLLGAQACGPGDGSEFYLDVFTEEELFCSTEDPEPCGTPYQVAPGERGVTFSLEAEGVCQR